MDEQMQKQLLDRLDLLASKLGVAAHAVFGLYVRQAYIDGFEYSVLLLASFLGLAWALPRASRAVKHAREEEFDKREAEVAALVLLSVVLVLIAVVCFTGSVDNLSNPQLSAFQTILHDLRK